MINSIAERRTFEWKGLSTLNTLPYQKTSEVNFKLQSMQGEASDVNRVLTKLVDNDLYNEQLVLNIREGRNVPGATVTNLSSTVINSGDGQKFALTSIVDPHIIIGKKKIADNDDTVSCVPFFKGQNVNFYILDGRQYVVGTSHGLYCSGNRYEGWHKVGEQGDDYFKSSFEKFDCKCCIRNEWMGLFGNLIDNYEYFLGTNSGVYGFSLSYEYGGDVQWENIAPQLIGKPINTLRMDPVEKCLFIGTDIGLYKYDGTSLILEKKTYTHDVRSVVCNDDSKLRGANEHILLGTTDGVLQSTNAYFPSSVEILNSNLSSLSVTTIGLGPGGNTVEFLGTRNGLYRYNGSNAPTPVTVSNSLTDKRVWGTEYIGDFLYVSIGGNVYCRRGSSGNFNLLGAPDGESTARQGSFRSIYKCGEILLVVRDNDDGKYLFYVDTSEEPEQIAQLAIYETQFGKINSITVHGDDFYVSSKNGIHIFSILTKYGHVLNRQTPTSLQKHNVRLFSLSDGRFLGSVANSDGTITNFLLSDSLTEIEDLSFIQPSSSIVTNETERRKYQIGKFLEVNGEIFISIEKPNGTVDAGVDSLLKLDRDLLGIEASAIRGKPIIILSYRNDEIFASVRGTDTTKIEVYALDFSFEHTLPLMMFDYKPPYDLQSINFGDSMAIALSNRINIFNVIDDGAAPVYVLDVGTDDVNEFAINKTNPSTGDPVVTRLSTYEAYYIHRAERLGVTTAVGKTSAFVMAGKETDPLVKIAFSNPAGITKSNHLLYENIIPEVTTNLRFILSSRNSTNLDIEYFRYPVNNDQVQEGSQVYTATRARSESKPAPIPRQLFSGEIKAVEHLKGGLGDPHGIAVATANTLSVFSDKSAIRELSVVWNTNSMQMLKDEIGKVGSQTRTITGRGNGAYFAYGQGNGKLYAPSGDGMTELLDNTTELIRPLVPGNATCSCSYYTREVFLTTIEAERPDPEDPAQSILYDKEVQIANYVESKIIGLSGGDLTKILLDGTWYSLNELGATTASDLENYNCKCIAAPTVHGTVSDTTFRARETPDKTYNLSSVSHKVTHLMPMFLVEDMRNNSIKILVNTSKDDIAVLTEMTGIPSGQTPIYIAAALNVVVVATNKTVKYAILTESNWQNTLTNFSDSNWKTLLTSTVDITDISFYGNHSDFIGIILANNAVRKYTIANDDITTTTTNDPGEYPANASFTDTQINPSSGGIFPVRAFSQFKELVAEAPEMKQEGQHYGYYYGYSHATYIAWSDGKLERIYSEKSPSANRAMVYDNSREVLVSLEDPVTPQRICGVTEEESSLKKAWEKIFVEVSTGDNSNTIDHTELILKGYDFAHPVVSLTGDNIKFVRLQKIDADYNGNYLNVLTYLEGADDAIGQRHIKVMVYGPDWSFKRQQSISWQADKKLHLDIIDTKVTFYPETSQPCLQIVGELTQQRMGVIGKHIIGCFMKNPNFRTSEANIWDLFLTDFEIICDDDIFLKPSPSGNPITLYGFVREDPASTFLVTGANNTNTGYSVCSIHKTENTRRRFILFEEMVLPMTLNQNTGKCQNFYSFKLNADASQDAVGFLAFNNEGSGKNIWMAITGPVNRSWMAGTVANAGGNGVGPSNIVTFCDQNYKRIYFNTGFSAGGAAEYPRSISYDDVYYGTSDTVLQPFLPEKVCNVKTNSTWARVAMTGTEPGGIDRMIFGTVRGVYSWGKYYQIILDTSKGEAGHVAFTKNPTSTEDLYDVSYCAVWTSNEKVLETGEDETVTNYIFSFDLDVYSVRFSFLSSNIESLTMQTENVCDGIESLPDGNFLINFRDSMNVLDIQSSHLINLELEDLETIYRNNQSADEFDANIYFLAPMKSGDNKIIYLMVNGAALVAFRNYEIKRCFDSPRNDYKIFRKRFWNKDVRNIFRLSDRDFIVGTTNGSFFVRNLEICTCYLDRLGHKLTGETLAVTSVLQDISKGLRPKYLFSSGDKIYYTTDTITSGEEITHLSAKCRVNYVCAENDTMYAMCTNVGLFITDMEYDIDDELHRFSIEAVEALTVEDLEPLLKGHELRDHDSNEFWQSMYKKAPAALDKVPEGFTSTAGLDLNNAVYIVSSDIVSRVEFENSNKYIKASVKNWMTDNLKGDSIYSTDGYIDRLELKDGTVYDMSKISYVCKFWNSGLREFIIHLPTTMTFYMNNPKGFSNCEYSGKSVPRLNVDAMMSWQNVVSDQYTRVRLLINNNHFGLRNISHIQINGDSLPLRIYKDDQYCQEGRENIFDGVIQPSVVRSLPVIITETNDTQNNVGSVGDGLGTIMLEFAVYGSDAQSIRILGNI